MRYAGCVLIVLTAFAGAGCSDDDDDGDAPRDAGSDGAAGRSGSGPRPGGSGGSGGSDRCHNGSCLDTFNCALYEKEDFAWPEGAAEGAEGMAHRTWLEVLCRDDCKPQETLDEFEARLRCVETTDDGGTLAPDDFDGGLPAGPWRRSEGCGRVQFSTHSATKARIFDFDRDTGKLTGFASFDLYGIVVAGTGQGFGCKAPAWVAGEVRGECASEVVSLCEVR